MGATDTRTLHADADGLLYEARPAKDGMVEFSRQGGGLVLKLPEDEFVRNLRPVTAEERDESLLYAKSAVTFDWMAEDGREPIPAWLNDRLWNGWRMPVFEKDDVAAAIADGRLGWLVHLPELDMFVAIEEAGEEVPPIEPDDLARKIQAARSDDARHVEIEIGGKRFDVDLYVREEIATKSGETVQVYPVGAGSWCWDEADRPTDEPAGPRP